MQVIKRNKKREKFDIGKVINAVNKAFISCNKTTPQEVYELLPKEFDLNQKTIKIEIIQDKIEQFLMSNSYYDVAVAYIKYRERHNEARFIKDRIDYMNKYSSSESNAATSSETDANSNVQMKNVANLEGEVYKTTNRLIQRSRMKDELNVLYPKTDLSYQYIKDLENHIIYVHDEASSPVLKYYCCAVTLYPMMVNGTGNIDGVTPTPPNDIASFSGQITNLIFLLSSQCKGAVAVGDYFIALNYYVIKEFGKEWYNKLDVIINNTHCSNVKTICNAIEKGMKQFIYGVNQPAGNRSYNSPFTNVSYYDQYYFNSLFEDFYYPDGTKPEWKAIDTLQRIFMRLHRKLRLIKPLTFPVSTMALVNDGHDIKDKEYKKLCADEWAKGGSFFCYTNSNPTSLASCCRVLNEMSENTFSSTTGMTGIMTGSCNVITLNLNRIVQNCAKLYGTDKFDESIVGWKTNDADHSCSMNKLRDYLINILERVYKYHIAFKTLLYDVEDAGMFAASNAGYIYMKKLYSTIGVIGYYEAAQFLGLKGSDYIGFLQLILGTIKEQNKLHSIHDKNRPFLFNTEAIPGESLGVKFYNWDKEDGYVVPEDQNLYNCYFYNPWDESGKWSILDKMKIHGNCTSKFTDGGQACHLNLDSHLSARQYDILLKDAIRFGTNYFTFNIPMSECADCSHVVNAPIDECPICHSKHIKYWTRIIGYLTCVDNWSKERQIEFNKRNYE